ncbi:MAG TPA: hypothetical protein VK735_00615 [Pseudonocardia sp.]|uniref:hypothetical protein n=1 Tax=Pseudonocardia sp. TaxID=60912 RepID=UPI002C9872B3|nr:hypothetical protein [Pseudonocardia sp.]HTF45928.1 hypothetical protein [Pseudonocardia sp.]
MDFRLPYRSEPVVGPGPDSSLPEAKPKGLSGRVLHAAVERALRIQQPAVAAHITRVRRNKPDATPAEVIAGLDKQYLITVGGLGAASGGTAFVPGVGTGVALATGAAEAIAALDASVLYTLAVAEVHGLRIEDVDRRRALVLAIVLGEGGAKLMQKVTGGARPWANELVDALPVPKLGPINQTLMRWFFKRYLARQGALAFGRALPLGVGAVIGAVGNLAVARSVIRSSERAFGPPPSSWPDPDPVSPEQ